VSHLRAYTPEDLSQMTIDLSNYRWEIQSIELQNGKFTVTCPLGLALQTGDAR